MKKFFALLLALVLVAGMGFFVAEYVTQAKDWVMFSGSPHVYSGGNIGCGTVVEARATIGPGTVVGRGCIISSGATIDRGVTLPDGTHIDCGRVILNGTVLESPVV